MNLSRIILSLTFLSVSTSVSAQINGCPQDANATRPFPPSVNGWEKPIDIRHIGYACTNKDSTFDANGYLSNHNVRHAGLDIYTEKGRRVRAIADGRVLKSYYSSNDPLNSFISIEHQTKTGKKFCAIYAHSSSKMGKGRWIKKGQMIGTIMDYPDVSRGPNDHLHFGIIPDSSDENCLSGWGRTPRHLSPSAAGFVDPLVWLSNNKAK